MVDAVALRDGADWRPASGRAQVSITGELHIHAGDRLRIFGKLEAPLPAANPGEFDSASFARTKRELSVVQVKLPECVRVVVRGSTWSPKRWIDGLRSMGD